MLPKEYRLTKNKDFENVHKKGEVLFSRNFILKFIKNDLKTSRFGFNVSLKISKKAVQRNLVKRQLREIFRLLLNEIKSGFDIIVIPKAGVLNLKFDLLKKEITDLLEKSGLKK